MGGGAPSTTPTCLRALAKADERVPVAHRRHEWPTALESSAARGALQGPAAGVRQGPAEVVRSGNGRGPSPSLTRMEEELLCGAPAGPRPVRRAGLPERPNNSKKGARPRPRPRRLPPGLGFYRSRGYGDRPGETGSNRCLASRMRGCSTAPIGTMISARRSLRRTSARRFRDPRARRRQHGPPVPGPAPNVVEAIHRAYLDAGPPTSSRPNNKNKFTASRSRRPDLRAGGARLRAQSAPAAEIARSIAGADGRPLVAGSLGPLTNLHALSLSPPG